MVYKAIAVIGVNHTDASQGGENCSDYHVVKCGTGMRYTKSLNWKGGK